jgi:hypothetical protein
MIRLEIHLYGKLRGYTGNKDPRSESTITVKVEEGTTIREALEKINVPTEDVGTNIFFNTEYSSLERPLNEDGRLGVFPDDMNLLYRWHFRKKEE